MLKSYFYVSNTRGIYSSSSVLSLVTSVFTSKL
nr:MAG TPA: hypothetical protein [Bacteriophage sp.]